MAYWRASGLSMDELEAALLEAEARIVCINSIDGADGHTVASQNACIDGIASHMPAACAAAGEDHDDTQQQRDQGKQRGQQQQHPAANDDGAAGPAGNWQCPPEEDEPEDGRVDLHPAYQAHPPLRRTPKGAPSKGRRWVPTLFDVLSPDARPLASEGLGVGGADLFSAAHVAAHVRATAALLQKLEDSRQWRQVAFGALQLWHHHDKELGLQEFRAHAVIDEPMVVSGRRGGGDGCERDGREGWGGGRKEGRVGRRWEGGSL